MIKEDRLWKRRKRMKKKAEIPKTKEKRLMKNEKRKALTVKKEENKKDATTTNLTATKRHK